MTKVAGEGGVEMRLVPTDGTAEVLRILAEDPQAPIECTFGGEPAVGVFDMPEGCVARPNDVVQALCPQHVITAEPLGAGKMELLVDLSVENAFSRSRLWGSPPVLDLDAIDLTLVPHLAHELVPSQKKMTRMRKILSRLRPS